MYYRKEIDGLRAIAILPVLWIHAGFPYLTGGFIGVDVFFVISGFLITSILLKELENNSFSIKNFYERRARRILPALITVITLTSFLTPLITLNPKFLGDYGASVISTILFASNIFFWQTSGYFGTVSELSPMLHTWSLAVEEQFYIFFPILLSLIYPFGRKLLIVVLMTVAISSLSIAEWGASNSAIANFYLLPSRAWELFSGALAAMLIQSEKIIALRARYSSLLALAGLTLIFSSYTFFSPNTAHPSALTLCPIIGTVLILLFASERRGIGKLLSNKILVVVGMMSYSLYLWHQPILALMKRKYTLHLSLNQAIFSIILTFLLSYLTWKFIESPLRNRRKYTIRFITRFSLISALAMILVGLLFNQNMHLQKVVFPEEMVRFEQLLEADRSHTAQIMYDDNKCKFWSSEFTKDFYSRFEECSIEFGNALFIIGGSHGMDLYNAIAINTQYPFIVSISKGFCRAHTPSDTYNTKSKCQYNEFTEFSKNYSENIALVIYSQTPDRLFTKPSMEQVTERDLNLNSVKQVANYLGILKNENNIEVIMLGMLPILKEHPIDWNYAKPFDQQIDGLISNRTLKLTKFVDLTFERILRKKDIPYYPKIEAASIDLSVDLMFEGKITYSDKRHLSSAGEKLFGSRIVKYLEERGYKLFNSKGEDMASM